MFRRAHGSLSAAAPESASAYVSTRQHMSAYAYCARGSLSAAAPNPASEVVRQHTSTYVYVCMYVCMHACMHACMHVCMYKYVCTYVCMYVCMYVYIERGNIPGALSLPGGGGASQPRACIRRRVRACLRPCALAALRYSMRSAASPSQQRAHARVCNIMEP